LLAGALFAASANATKLWTDSSATEKLRSITSLPKNQPDALEFANEGPVEFRLMRKGFVNPITCTEVELGTTVLGNESLVKKVIETRLAMPFGIAEGDDCNGINSSGGPETVPTYFDTSAAGAVTASIAITGTGPFTATIENLRVSQEVEKGTFCTTTIQGVSGEISNVTAGFVEESPPNLNVGFSALVPVVCGKEKVSSVFNAKFFLETMSSVTDTAFITP
jgi:hypothetical protein